MERGQFIGTVTYTRSSEIGGSRNVFVKLEGKPKEVRPTGGFEVKNPFKQKGKKIFEGDLGEYRVGGVGYLLKTYEVAADVAADATVVYIIRDGFRHIPEATDVLMKSPDTLDGTGASSTVLLVEKTELAGVDVWKVTLTAAIGAMTKGDVMVEADSASETAKMLVQNPNCWFPVDYDFCYDPALNDDDDDGARFGLTPIFNEVGWIAKMSPIPPCVLKERNDTLVEGWFKFKTF